jgi:hypothetical protein
MDTSRALGLRSLLACVTIVAHGCGQQSDGSDVGDTVDGSSDVAQHDTAAENGADADAYVPCNSPNNLVRCKGMCVDLGKDPNNCGACGVKCCPDQLCGDGRCINPCGAGGTECPSTPGCTVCVELSNDPRHCGGCDVVCSSGTCVDGSCATPDAASDADTDAASDADTD